MKMTKYRIFISIFLVIFNLNNISLSNESNYISDKKMLELQDKERKIREKLLVDPNNDELHIELGRILMNLGELDEALKECCLAVNLAPKNQYHLFARANVYMRMEKYDNAIVDLNKIIEIDPNEEGAYANLSIIYRNKKEYNRAIENCQTALRIKEDDDIYYQLGCIYMDMGDTEKARELFNKVISMAGRDSSLGELALYKIGELRKLEPKPTGPTLGYEGYIPSVDEAVEVSLSWIDIVDKGQYEESWNTSAEYLRNTIDKERWEQSLKSVRTSLGKVVSRKLKTKEYTKTLPGAPDGEYVIIQYETSFEKKQYAIETVIPMIDKDGKWRVSGYYIR